MRHFVIILDKTSAVSEGVGHGDISRLRQALGYWAPELVEQRFWYGAGSTLGYLDILNTYFQDNDSVRTIYNNFMNTMYKSTIEV